VILRAYREDELEEAVRQGRAAESRVGGTPTREHVVQRVERSGVFVDGHLELAIEVDGRLSGSIQARSPERALPPGVCELGVELVPEARGRGAGTEAVRLLGTYLLEHGYPRVQASTAVDNVAMRRALERAGFAFEGVQREFMPTEDRRADYALYALTR
jgi:RimJ/RimL family protein N-acetyltransferase